MTATHFEPALVNLDAERATLGSILLLATDSPPDTFDRLERAHFTDSRHVAVFEAMAELVVEAAAVEGITVADRLARRDRKRSLEGDDPAFADKQGALDFVVELAESVTTSANLEHYFKMLDDALQRRRVKKIGAELVRFSSSDLEPKELIDRAISTLSVADDPPGHSAVVSGGAAAREFLHDADKAAKGGEPCVPTGYVDLDATTGGLAPGELVIFGGRPSTGKTTLALNIAGRFALDHGRSVLVYSLEMSAKALMGNLLSARSRIPAKRIRQGRLNGDEWSRVAEEATRISDAKIEIDTRDTTASRIRTRARRLQSRDRLDLIVVDYLQLLTNDREWKNRKDLEVAEQTRTLKRIAMELEVPVLLLSQLNRDVDKRPKGKPQLSDLRDSGAIEQDADKVLFIVRKESKAEIIVAKNRNGPLGSAHLTFHGECFRFYDSDL